LKIHAISTGRVRITKNWQIGREDDSMRLAHTLFDKHFTDWLPIYCFVVEHPEGLIVIDTGIPVNPNKPIWFPPWMRLLQRAAYFDKMTKEDEIGPQLQQRGLSSKDVRWVVMTHLHQDHDGGLHHFPNAEIVITQNEWRAATGFGGKIGGYLNHRWPTWLSPTLIDFDHSLYYTFPKSHTLTKQKDIHLVPTQGHSAGQMAVILEENSHFICFAGDVSYTQQLMLDQQIDGVSPNVKDAQQTLERMYKFVQTVPTVYLPSHDPDSGQRLMERKVFKA
jgi:glyoxylase-like metal-dependent hydrolase (beta-lactamase superfamily II)